MAGQHEIKRSSGRPVHPPELFGETGRTAVQRALGEFLGGRPVVIAGEGKASVVALPVEALTPARLAELAAFTGRRLELFVSGTRAAALGSQGVAPGVIPLPAAAGYERVMALAGHADVTAYTPMGQGDAIAAAAIELAKLAHLLPAVLAAPLPCDGTLEPPARTLRVAAQDVLAFRAAHAASLRLVSRARVPLPGAPDCDFMVFRDDLGETWTAVQVGQPDRAAPVSVRLHSACLTGDAFGSLRCDCGDQLRMAIETLMQRGGGMLLYLSQEGCGLGLVNKMRAYALQDRGLDTLDANTTLGFERDERRYEVAARMLEILGIGRIALLTNNPSKLQALRAAGIGITERIPLIAPVNSDNRRYLDAKRQRAGHLIDPDPSSGSAQPGAVPLPVVREDA